MGKVTIQNLTPLHPIELIGMEAGVCWGGNTVDPIKNYNRGLDCLNSGHMRTAEYPQIYMVLEGYSARVIREFYTHIGGMPTRLQASTRYIDYNNFQYVIPPSVTKNAVACGIYLKAMEDISTALKSLEALGTPREDCGMILPLCMTTTVVVRTNLRNLIDMCKVRLCSRAYWEMRQLIMDILKALKEYSNEWETVVDNFCKVKCEITGYCDEKNSCGRKPYTVQKAQAKVKNVSFGKILGKTDKQ